MRLDPGPDREERPVEDVDAQLDGSAVKELGVASFSLGIAAALSEVIDGSPPPLGERERDIGRDGPRVQHHRVGPLMMNAVAGEADATHDLWHPQAQPLAPAEVERLA